MSVKFPCVVVFLCVAMSRSTATSLKFSVIEKDPGSLVSLALRVCHNTIQQSEQKLFHIVDFNCNPTVPILIEALHNSSIPTVLMTSYCELIIWRESNQMRNIIFFLDDIEEILSLILSSASREGKNCGRNVNRDEDEQAFTHTDSMPEVNRTYKTGCQKINTFLRYCVTVDGYPMGDGKCDEHMFISSAELDGSADLSDLNFNTTRSLHTNPIWNSNNYLIFMLSKSGRNTYNFNTCVYPQERPHDPSSENKTSPENFDALVYCFKFIWRFFRGLKTVICHKKSCSRYDPFAENIIQYNGEGNQTYFDSSINNLNGKTLNIILAEGQYHDIANEADAEWFRDSLKFEILDKLEVSLNCKFQYLLFFPDHVDEGQKFNVHLQEPGIFASSEEIDLSIFDFSVGVEMEAVCIITPHSELMPQCLVPFKVFTTPVWIFILVTAAVFVLIQRVFLKAQSGFFLSLYSEEEISPYSTASSLYIIYAYFIRGSPPRLLLGKLFTGKVLFWVFIFSAFIISNVFLGGMTTLLANTVRYPEIDTLKDLEDSDLAIQVTSVESAAVYFTELGLSEKLMAKLSSNVQWSIDVEDKTMNSSIIWQYYLGGNTTLVASEEFARNLRVALENDAFLVELPHSLRSETRVVVTRWPLKDKIEYHVVEECLKTYPFIFRFLKNSYLFSAFNKKTAQFLETGHHLPFSGRKVPLNVMDSAPPKDEAPRPYSLNDLQLPFLCLFAGLFLSFAVFSAEMVMEDFENAFLFRMLRHLKNYLLSIQVIKRFVVVN